MGGVSFLSAQERFFSNHYNINFGYGKSIVKKITNFFEIFRKFFCKN